MQNADTLFFLEKNPKALPLYQLFQQRVCEMIPDAHIKVQKTQITFFHRRNFAFVSFLPVRPAKLRPDPFITVSFGLRYHLDSPRIDAAVEAYPNRWTHHVLISSPEEIRLYVNSWGRDKTKQS